LKLYILIVFSVIKTMFHICNVPEYKTRDLALKYVCVGLCDHYTYIEEKSCVNNITVKRNLCIPNNLVCYCFSTSNNV
jgi:hypothetical protein